MFLEDSSIDSEGAIESSLGAAPNGAYSYVGGFGGKVFIFKFSGPSE